MEKDYFNELVDNLGWSFFPAFFNYPDICCNACTIRSVHDLEVELIDDVDFIAEPTANRYDLIKLGDEHNAK